MQSQNFRILHNGIIQSGELEYRLNPETGEIGYSGKVFVTWFNIEKDLPASKSKIDPAMVLSSHYNKPGQKLVLDQFSLVVTSVHEGKASCDLMHPSARGKAIIDVSKKYVKIVSIDAEGSFYGYNLHLVMQAV